MHRKRWTAPRLRGLAYLMVALTVLLIAAGVVLLVLADERDGTAAMVAVVVAGLGGMTGVLSMIPAALAGERS